MEEILQQISKKAGISQEEILQKRGNADICEARRIFIFLASKYHSRREIAEFLGRTQSDIGEQLTKIHAEIKIYKSVREKLSKYEIS